jgi:hypothetical protein
LSLGLQRARVCSRRHLFYRFRYDFLSAAGIIEGKGGSQSASADEQGGILGVTQSLSSLAHVLGPIWGGVMFDIGFQWPYLTAAGFMFPAFILGLKSQARSSPAFSLSAPPEPSGQKQS